MAIVDDLKQLHRDLNLSLKNIDKSETTNELLKLSFCRVVINKANKGLLDTKEYTEAVHKYLPHIADWVEQSVSTNQDWLNNIDDLGRPKKLMKFSTVEQIFEEANKSMLIQAQKYRKLVLNAEDEELIQELDNGYYVVKLLSSEALDYESGYMQHCIGLGAYDQKIKNNEIQYLSLRDPFGKPHITIELKHKKDKWIIEQFEGKQNLPPLQKYCDIILPFLKEQKLHLKEASLNLPFVTDNNGIWHNIFDLPDTLDIDVFSYISLDQKDGNTLPVRLPSNFINTTRINILGANLVSTFNNYPSNTDFSLSNVKFLNDQPEIKTTGKFYIYETEFPNPPEYIEAGAVLWTNSNQISWPKKLKVSGLADLSGVLPDFPIQIDAERMVFSPFLKANNHENQIKINEGYIRLESGYALPKGVEINKLKFLSYDDMVEDDLNIYFRNNPKITGFIDVETVFDYYFPPNVPNDTPVLWNEELITLEEYKNMEYVPQFK